MLNLSNIEAPSGYFLPLANHARQNVRGERSRSPLVAFLILLAAMGVRSIWTLLTWSPSVDQSSARSVVFLAGVIMGQHFHGTWMHDTQYGMYKMPIE